MLRHGLRCRCERQGMQVKAVGCNGTGGGARGIVVMGVSGTGKTTLSRRLGAQLDCPVLEGDAFHSAANVAKMRDGRALTDADRWPGWIGSAWRSAKPQRRAERPSPPVPRSAGVSRAPAGSGGRAAILRLPRHRCPRNCQADEWAQGPLYAAQPARQSAGDAGATGGGRMCVDAGCGLPPEKLIAQTLAWVQRD